MYTTSTHAHTTNVKTKAATHARKRTRTKAHTKRITLLLEPPQMSCDINIPPPPCGLFKLFFSSYASVYAMCDSRLLLPVLARTLEEMFNLNDDYIFN